MNTITIDQFKDIINTFNLTTSNPYNFSLTETSSKPICFHENDELTSISFNQAGEYYSYLKCKKCKKEFDDYHMMSENQVKADLRKHEIELKQIFIMDRKKNVNLKSFTKAALNKLYEETFSNEQGSYKFNLCLMKEIIPKKQFVDFLIYLSESDDEKFQEFIINIFKHLITKDSNNWTNKSFKYIFSSFNSIYDKMGLNDRKKKN